MYNTWLVITQFLYTETCLKETTQWREKNWSAITGGLLMKIKIT